MAFMQFAVILALAAVASAGVIAAPVVAAVAAPIAVDSWAYPRYSFNYGVSDGVTGDNHGRWETRDGDLTRGGYQLVEPDGTIRQVEYTSDPVNGFNAVVRRGGASLHAAPVIAAAPVVAAAPVAAVSTSYSAAAAPVAPVGGWGLGAGWGVGAAGRLI